MDLEHFVPKVPLSCKLFVNILVYAIMIYCLLLNSPKINRSSKMRKMRMEMEPFEPIVKLMEYFGLPNLFSYPCSPCLVILASSNNII